ncbi:dihydrolipoyllysine-residue succinyltransferase [Buchnera aphidicola (Ceratovacuna keduensis)]|uniref:dihydrolipoyllysine-residue succinyltransferase n=1 Tax=Buchnera aphidicola TaxID=9 RepID=UPI0031B87783
MNDNIINIYAPEFPESVTNATIISWKKKIYEKIKKNETILEIETDKIIMSVSSPSDGILKKIYKKKGSNINSKQILGKIENIIKKNEKIFEKKISPSVRRLITENNINKENINNIVKKNRITKKDIKEIINEKHKKNKIFEEKNKNKNFEISKKEKIKKSYTISMSNLRKKISERLGKTKKNAIMLTTFNEVNMKKIIKIRNKYKKEFLYKYKIKLGFMSFFIKSVIESLKEFPEINTTIDEEKITYYNCYNINIAISTNKGLIAPIIKNADIMSMQEIEKKIINLKKKAEKNDLKISEMSSGSFTISNGGVFGSLFSTPIINYPQTAILGIHEIKNRPIVIKNKVKIRPMTYLSLSYDHRVIDGKNSINFLKNIKNILEDFSRVILQV